MFVRIMIAPINQIRLVFSARCRHVWGAGAERDSERERERERERKGERGREKRERERNHVKDRFDHTQSTFVRI